MFADVSGGVELVIYLIVAVVFAIGSLIKAAARKAEQAKSRERGPGGKAGGWRAPADEVKQFLEQVSGERPGGTPAPRAVPEAQPVGEGEIILIEPDDDQDRLREELLRRQRAAAAQKRAAAVSARRRQMAALAEAQQAPGESVVMRRVEEASPARRPRSGDRQVTRSEWINRLPKASLKRAVMLAEILGPPRGLRRSVRESALSGRGRRGGDGNSHGR